MSDWIEWNGGDCPVKSGQRIYWKLRSGLVSGPIYYSNDLEWDHIGDSSDIIAYRLSKANGDKDE